MDAAFGREIQALQDGNFSSDDIGQFIQKRKQDLVDAGGLSPQELDSYFKPEKKPEPDMSATKKYFSDNLKQAQEQNTPAATGPEGDRAPSNIIHLGDIKAPAPLEVPLPKIASSHPPENFLDAVKAGFQLSVTGLVINQKNPEIILPEDAPFFYKIASQVGTLAGDLPAMYAGNVAGAFMGAPVGAAIAGPPGVVAGAALGAGFGAFALPSALRHIMMDHYEKGDVQDFQDFWARASGTFIDSMKSGLTGLATVASGGLVNKLTAPMVMPVVSKTLMTLAAEVATMTTVGKALDGKVPQPSDFASAAILIAGLHGVGMTAGKLRNIYAKTGITPENVLQKAQEDPSVRQDLLSDNVEIPKAYSDGKSEPDTKTINAGEKLSEQSNVLGGGKSDTTITISKPKEVDSSGGESPKDGRPPEVNDILKSIGTPKEKTNGYSWQRFYESVVDKMYPFKVMTDILKGDGPLKKDDNPYVLSRLISGATSKAEHFIKYGSFDPTTKGINGKSLDSILEPVKDDIDGFKSYLISSRVLELNERGIETGIDVEKAQTVVDWGKDKFEQSKNDLVDYQNHLVDYLVKSGVIKLKAADNMKEMNKSYIPFYRIMDEEQSTGGKGSGLAVFNPIKAIKGSERLLVDPLESVVRNTFAYIKLADKNNVLVNLAELAEKSPIGNDFMEKVPTPMEPIEVKSQEINKFFDEHGLQSDSDTATIFRPNVGRLAPDEIALYREGVREVWQMKQAEGMGVVRAVKALDSDSVALMVKLIEFPARVLRTGAVLTPDFIARHYLRQQILATNFSQDGYKAVFTSLEGLGHIWGEDETYQQWLRSGGGNSAISSIDTDYIQKEVYKVQQQTGFMNNAWNLLKSPIEIMRAAFELQENMSRVGQFAKALPENPTAEDITSAGFSSREVAMDYSRMGSQVKVMNLITAFFNAHIQGLDLVGRAFKDNPLGTLTKIGASITLPSLALWAVNHNDPRWQEIPRWQKDLFWIVMGKDNIYRIPKPFELGLVFGSLPERIAEAYFTDHPNAMKDFGDSMIQAFSPSFIPTFANPLIGQFANRSTLGGQNIIPKSLEGIDSDLQYKEYTSETAKALSKMIVKVPGFTDKTHSHLFAAPLSSPMMLEHYITAWSGNMGTYALQLADKALGAAGVLPNPQKASPTLADVPAIKAFLIRYPSSSAQSIQDFYDNYERSSQVSKTDAHLRQSQNFGELANRLSDPIHQQDSIKLKSIYASLSKQTILINTINITPSYSPTEKRQLIDGLYYTMIAEAKAGNGIINGLHKKE